MVLIKTQIKRLYKDCNISLCKIYIRTKRYHTLNNDDMQISFVVLNT